MGPDLAAIGRRYAEELRLIALPLAILTAGIHLLHPQLGLPRLIIHLQLGTIFDPRPLVFTLAGLALVVGIILAGVGRHERLVYGLGIVVVVSFLLGYGAWHTILDHGGFWPYIRAHGHTDAGPLSTIAFHLFDDPVALLSKVVETLLLVVLTLLFLGEGE